MYKIVSFGDELKTAEHLRASARAAEYTLPVMNLIVADMFRIEEIIFSSGGRRGGGSWKPLKPDTLRRKTDTRTLIETGDLFRSVTEPDAPYGIADVTNATVTFGTDRVGATTHQYGDASRGIPARPFIKFIPADIKRWSNIIRKYVMGAYHE